MSETASNNRIAALGWRVQDAVTGIKGIATARAEYLNGCVRYCIQPPAEGNAPATTVEWVDWQQIVVLDHGCQPAIKDTTARLGSSSPAVGGPRRDAPRR